MTTAKKRAAEDVGVEVGKATKSARTEKSRDGVKPRANKAVATGATLSSADFKAKALPLHLNLTHTPPTILKEDVVGEKDNEEAGLETATASSVVDAGSIGNLTLVPTVFSTKSYGWKGNKRLTIELQDGDMDAEGGKEKVQIMLTVNATVIGSKPKSSKGKEKEKEDVAEQVEHVDPDEEESHDQVT